MAKNNLYMYKSEVAMRGSLNTKELEYQKTWIEENHYKKRLELNKDNEKFLLLDGPPYANGPIHLGHALNKVLKDMIIRSKNMQGFYTPYVMGWDTHGLPIEHAVTTKKKVNRKEMSVAEFRKYCEEYALTQVDNQKEQFKRLGINTDYETFYLTLHKEHEAEQIEVFNRMLQRGLIYKGLKPIYWSWSSESALAEAEIEYKDVNSTAIYIKNKVVDGKGVLEEGTNLVAWTTTPWSYAAVNALSVGSNIEYGIYSIGDEKYVFNAKTAEDVLASININEYKLEGTILGKDLEFVTFKHSFNDSEGPVILGDHVLDDQGTGIVTTAGGHGEDDFIVAKKYDLEIISVIDSKGHYNDFVGENRKDEWSGLFYTKASEKMVDYLEECGNLLAKETINHPYPHDWRTKKPVLYRATPQWFVNLKSIRPELLDAVKDVYWKVSSGAKRISNMIENRDDWCISRQRAWGVPIPIFYNEDGSEVTDEEVITHVANLFKEHGSNIWFMWETKDLMPENYTNVKSPNGNFTKEKDIMDVWFDSGVVHSASNQRFGGHLPVDLILEGSDQYRGWFNSMMSTSVAANKQNSYKAVLQHGFTLDEKGNKMSKSLGNTVDPVKLSNTVGSDILRLWVSSVDYSSDVKFGDNILKQVSEQYRKIRNTLRFIDGVLVDYVAENTLEYSKLESVDRWMINKTNDLNEKVIGWFNDYEFAKINKELSNFINNEVSAFYLDFSKDVLYIENPNSLRKQQIQFVLKKIYDTLLTLITPIIPHTAYEFGKVSHKHLDNIFLSNFEKVQSYDDKSDLYESFDKFFELRNRINSLLEQKREEKIIGKSFEAEIRFNEKYEEQLKFLENQSLDQLLIVSKVIFTNDVDDIEVVRAEGIVCPRCRKIVSENDMNSEEMCNSCFKQI